MLDVQLKVDSYQVGADNHVIVKPEKFEIECPHCGENVVVDNALILAAAGKIARTFKKNAAARPRVMKKCPYCKIEFSTSELRFHKARCESRPPNLPGPKPNPKASRASYLKSLKRNPNVSVEKGVVKRKKP